MQQKNKTQRNIKNDIASETFQKFCETFNIHNIVKSKIFTEAMTHSSVSKKNNYERMEFLGDTILNFCISKMLFEKIPTASEGVLSKKKSFLCSRAICRKVSEEIGLNEIVQVADKQKIDVKYILADVLESFLCAIYYEFDIDKVYQLVETLFTKHMTSADAIDPKMQLQEMTQKKYKTLPTYSLITKEGSEHEPMFKVAVSCGDLYAEGTGKNKKNAEKQAAKNMLNLLQINKKA